MTLMTLMKQTLALERLLLYLQLHSWLSDHGITIQPQLSKSWVAVP